MVYFAISLLRLLSDVESQLANKNSALMGQYAQGLGLCIVALLRRYLPCLLVSTENTSQVCDVSRQLIFREREGERVYEGNT